MLLDSEHEWPVETSPLAAAPRTKVAHKSAEGQGSVSKANAQRCGSSSSSDKEGSRVRQQHVLSAGARVQEWGMIGR